MLVAKLEIVGEYDRRGAVRYTADAVSTLRGPDAAPMDIIVEDFSISGFSFSSDMPVPVDTLVSVGLSGAGSRDARILWCQGTRHGCQFLEPLSDAEVGLAFKGQEAVIAELEAALARRLPTARRARAGLFARAKRWFGL